MRAPVSRLLCLAFVGALALPAAAAPEKPTAAEVTKVFDYFNKGQGKGPVLLVLEPCLKVGRKEGEPKKACVEPATDAVPAKTTVFAFTRFFVPAGDTYEVTFEWSRDGEVISSKEAKVLTGYAYGTWKGTTLRKPGNYTIAIKLGDEVRGSAKVTVKE